MSKEMVIQALRNPIYRATLSSEQINKLPKHPCGTVNIVKWNSTILIGSSSAHGNSCCGERKPIV